MMKEYVLEKLKSCKQICKLAVSIISNLAEDTLGKTLKDQVNFSTISYNSIIELLIDLTFSKDITYISEDQNQEGSNLVEYQTLLIANLRYAQCPKIEVNYDQASQPFNSN